MFQNELLISSKLKIFKKKCEQKYTDYPDFRSQFGLRLMELFQNYLNQKI